MILAYRSAHAQQFLLTKRAAAKFVPKLLNFEQKHLCMDIAQEMLTPFNEYLLKKFITGDESWIAIHL